MVVHHARVCGKLLSRNLVDQFQKVLMIKHERKNQPGATVDGVVLKDHTGKPWLKISANHLC